METDLPNPPNHRNPQPEWSVGKRAALVKTMQLADVEVYTRLIRGDDQIIEKTQHLEDDQEERITVPAMLLGGLIGAAIQQYFCESGSMCLNQYLEFIAPAFAGDTVTAVLEVDHVQADRPILRLKTACTNQNGQALVTGQAVILMPQGGEPRSKS
jgi:acyl dehydratase